MTVASHAPFPCDVCNREWRGVAFKAPSDRFQKHFCSFRCSEVYMLARAKQIEITRNEQTAALAGGKLAGAFLEGIGKTNFADMTASEWETFCQTLFAGACADLARQADAHVPF